VARCDSNTTARPATAKAQRRRRITRRRQP
jgi:hypothetical protein